jgi:hypothetical protein
MITRIRSEVKHKRNGEEKLGPHQLSDARERPQKEREAVAGDLNASLTSLVSARSLGFNYASSTIREQFNILRPHLTLLSLSQVRPQACEEGSARRSFTTLDSARSNYS